MKTPKTAGEFVQVLEQSQLIAPGQLRRIRAQIPPPKSPGFDAASFAQAVVNEGLLTTYQMRLLLAGRAEGFFIGKYRLLDVLGEGGMGKVFLAEQTTMKRAVALKLVRFSEHEDLSRKIRFTREARAAAKLHHPNITPAYDFDQTGPYHYIAMEFIEGINLQQWVDKTGQIPWAQAAALISQAANGLEHAWQHRLVHRDIKPSNLMVEPSGVLKILDLGLVNDSAMKDSLTVLHLNLILGTADYVSPEQALNSHQVDIRADIYSLGAVMFFLLCGRPPFPEKSMAAKIIAHQTVQPPSVQELAPMVPKRLADVVQRMLAKKPDDRFARPAEVVKALKPFAQLASQSGPAYDLSLVRFSREQVEKCLRFGGDPPAIPQTPMMDFDEDALDEDCVDLGALTPQPLSCGRSTLGDAKPIEKTNPVKPATPRGNTPKPVRTKLPVKGKSSSPPLLLKENAKPAAVVATKKTPIPKTKKQVSKVSEPLAVSKAPDQPRKKAKGKSRILVILLLFAIPNILGLLLLFTWLTGGK